MMGLQEIKELLRKGLRDCEVVVTGDPSGSHIDVSIVGQIFDGMSRVKRQQIVYGLLRDHIADGSIHAVTMQLRTPAESVG